MNIRIIAAACVAGALAGCAGLPLDRATERQHVERNCRVQASMSPAYAIDSTGIGLGNVAYDRCLRTAGSRPVRA
ncbi:MAG: hypothetical protein BGP10_07895 [Rhodanobacter sp. 68-29]|uniref:hypothetical protein n=1 Tax=Rhodanobacter sp. PCA2 TaxID=2006117 RepID=UPI00086B425D|nr:hypothetical protein [Rhodanobacter sp. PCA2]MBA2077012.1 hypothetical protein [Rhodanobacter sp. PCA2]MBN8923777.1 hypothetical protein [Rhodanobacter sp.]ODU75648.1 MAG: hypothetical protein ABT17_02730 [Rhodanobacter sp. SCN 69-32]OJY56935.1 MAG: hypothetical protein BGP10_07895 [Rhodanobacter sp. 68-29]